MRILFLGNNWLAWQIVAWLRKRHENIVGLVLHPPSKRQYGEEICNDAQIAPEFTFDGSQLHRPKVLQAIKALNADIALSVLFGYIVRPGFIDQFPAGVINLHPSYLPYNRGAYPNVWSIVDGTPAGVTLHYIDRGVDTGDTIAQRRLSIEPVDTGQTLYRKLEQASIKLFHETWPLIRAGQAPRTPQDQGQGTSHRARDAAHIDHIDLDQQYSARELINVIRARSFPPYAGAYFIYQGRKVYMRIQLYYEDQPSEPDKM